VTELSYFYQSQDGENTMTSQNEDTEYFRTKDFDPFPEPRTIPSGWDLSELLASQEFVPVVESDLDADNQPH
jgi:hypothetical protein